MKYFTPLALFYILAAQNLSAQLTATTSSTNPSCAGNNGSATVTPGGGSGYTYKWSNGNTTSAISNLSAGTYIVTVYSGGGTVWDSVYLQTFDSTVQTWSINISTGNNGNANNYWNISDSCIGNGAIGACVNNTYSPSAGSNKSLFVTSQPNGYGVPQYAGARYDAGGSILGQSLCGTLSFCTETNMAAQSPNINTTGAHNLVLSFQYTAGGNGLIDNASLLYSNNGGTSFNILDSSLKSVNSGSCMADGDIEGTWAYKSYVLPANCVNISNLVIRFNWTNDGLDVCNCASDPSVAIDNVTLRDSLPGNGVDSIVKSVTLAASSAPHFVTTSLSITQPVCGQNNGTITGLGVTGGTHPYTIEWDNSSNVAVGNSYALTNVGPDTYTFYVTDSAGCKADTSFKLQVSGGARIVSTGLVVINPSCGQNNGSIIGLTVSGGKPPVTVKWTDSTNTILNHTDSLANVGAGLYTFTVTDSAGCSNDTSIRLRASGAASAPVISAAKDSFCSGDTVAVCPSPQNYAHYSWNIGDTTACISVTLAGTYSLTVRDNNGCSASSNSLSFGQYSPSPVTVSANGDTLTCYAANSVQWYLNGTKITGATSSVYVATASGSYTVEITDVHGCKATSTPQEVVVGGIAGIKTEVDFAFYPNPATSSVQILFGAALLGKELEIFDASGRIVLIQKINSTKLTIAIDALSNGVYCVKVNGLVKKLVKE